MDIFTLLKANIRHKKGSFVSIMILMLIVSMAFTAIFSIKANCENSIHNALDSVNVGNLNLFISNEELSEDCHSFTALIIHWVSLIIARLW